MSDAKKEKLHGNRMPEINVIISLLLAKTQLSYIREFFIHTTKYYSYSI